MVCHTNNHNIEEGERAKRQELSRIYNLRLAPQCGTQISLITAFIINNSLQIRVRNFVFIYLNCLF